MSGLLLRCGAAWMGLAAFVSAAEPWPQWRGPHGDGYVTDAPPPIVFSADNIVWKTPLPGSGQSSPVVWDDRIFLTSYLDRGAERLVFAVDRHSGKLLWQKTAWKGTPEPSHQMNGWASATCATDGERVYAFFGRGGGLFCYSRDGELLWNNPLGPFEGPWGTAACPILLDDLVIQNCDSESNARLEAFDKLTGKPVWTAKRDDYRGWSTPFIDRRGSRTQIILNGHTGVRSYDPKDGKELWFCSSQVGRGEPTVTPFGRDRIVVLNGLGNGALYAVQTDGSGDVSGTKRVWETPRKTPRDLPSPAIIGNSVLIMSQRTGILTCFDVETGKQVWQDRIGGDHAASPVVLDGKALFVAESGEVLVIDPAANEHIVARNNINAPQTEIFRASLAAHEGQWLLRSNTVLYCIGAR